MVNGSGKIRHGEQKQRGKVILDFAKLKQIGEERIRYDWMGTPWLVWGEHR
ncbi:hypothetical protein D082_05390 [Synechocystis sp. PCC 6714]|nr:hypothetical protein D082_05390 [Synechocystis sp. PCC 6714]